MAAIGALVLYLTFVALGFGWRSWRQYRLTGSTGFHGISGRPGSPEWAAGVGFVLAMLLGLLAPALQVFGVLAQSLLSRPGGFRHWVRCWRSGVSRGHCVRKTTWVNRGG